MAIASTTLSMSAGTSVEISAPVDTLNGQGPFAPIGNTVKFNGKDVKHVRGFVSENISVGTLEPIGETSIKVKYKHIQNKENRLYFFNSTDDIFMISIIATPIHDHSSIHQGGPAYGTYYYDKPKEEPEDPPADGGGTP